jgi:excinuclease ABC subunit C
MARPAAPSDSRAAGTLDLKIERLPVSPGVYRFLDAQGKTLYVGKAKSLRVRVRSYFRPSADLGPRIARMVSRVTDVDVIVVDTEAEARILEANLVKRERPRYNVVLRDDKSFPYVRLSLGDEYPRASLVRRARVDGDLYVGPFLPAAGARRTLKLVQRYFRVATCKEVFDGGRRPCLYYHLDQCLAPCAGKTDPVEYGRAVEDAQLFLSGRHRDLEASLDRRMRAASETREYEAASRYRDTLRTVQSLAVRQNIVSVGMEDQDYFAHHREGSQVALETFQVRAGRVQARRSFTMEEVEMDDASFYTSMLLQYYQDEAPPPEVYAGAEPETPEILAGWLAERRGGPVTLRVPRRGEKRKLLELVRKNAELVFQSRFRSEHSHGVEVLERLAEALGLDEPPYRIECFDISNLHGTDSVASLVVWEAGRPKKSDYRTFTIRGVSGPDDYASIAEAVTRRYRRLVEEDRRLPDLVLIDGGEGQLGAAVAALARVGLPMLAVAAIAKREELLYLRDASDPVRLDRGSPALQLIQRIRDEAHRFAVTRHRGKRRRRTIRTELTELAGIGPTRARKLLREFGSLAAVRAAPAEELARVVGPRLAAAIVARYGRRRDESGEPGAAGGGPRES